MQPSKEIIIARSGKRSVFLSFKTEEKEQALILKRALEEDGYVVWWQEDLQCGQAWHEEIDKAVNSASAIIVIWSEAAMGSRWVQHEASQAIAKGVYAPVRLEPMIIESPFDRIQATDIIDWVGDKSHPGYQNLVLRLKGLIPPPLTATQRIGGLVRRNKVTLITSIIATATVIMLLSIIRQQQELFKNNQEVSVDIQRQLMPLDSLNVTLDFELDAEFPGVQELISESDSVAATYEIRPFGSRLVDEWESSAAMTLVQLIKKHQLLFSFSWPEESSHLQTLRASDELDMMRFRTGYPDHIYDSVVMWYEDTDYLYRNRLCNILAVFEGYTRIVLRCEIAFEDMEGFQLRGVISVLDLQYLDTNVSIRSEFNGATNIFLEKIILESGRLRLDYDERVIEHVSSNADFSVYGQASPENYF